MEEKGYTWFGEVLYRILNERGSSQSALAREAPRAWPGLPAELRLQLDARRTRGAAGAAYAGGGALRADTQEWIELGLAFAYGQRVRRRDLQDLRDFRTRYKYFFIEQEGLSFAAKTIED